MRYETSRAVHMRMGRASGTHAYSLLRATNFTTQGGRTARFTRRQGAGNGFLQANLPPASPERKKENRNPNEG